MGGAKPIEWRIDVGSSRLLRAVVYAELAVFGGRMVLVRCGALFLGVVSVLDGRRAYLAYLALLALIGDPLSLPYLLPMLTNAD